MSRGGPHRRPRPSRCSLAGSGTPSRVRAAAALAVQANCLGAVGRQADALAADVEAIRTLSPAFIQNPAAFGHWMGPMVEQYQQRCERLGRSLDMELLGPVLTILEKPKQENRGEH